MRRSLLSVVTTYSAKANRLSQSLHRLGAGEISRVPWRFPAPPAVRMFMRHGYDCQNTTFAACVVSTSRVTADPDALQWAYRGGLLRKRHYCLLADNWWQTELAARAGHSADHGGASGRVQGAPLWMWLKLWTSKRAQEAARTKAAAGDPQAFSRNMFRPSMRPVALPHDWGSRFPTLFYHRRCRGLHHDCDFTVSRPRDRCLLNVAASALAQPMLKAPGHHPAVADAARHRTPRRINVENIKAFVILRIGPQIPELEVN